MVKYIIIAVWLMIVLMSRPGAVTLAQCDTMPEGMYKQCWQWALRDIPSRKHKIKHVRVNTISHR